MGATLHENDLPPLFKFELGDTVKDSITGYEGVVIGRTEWLNGCKRYVIQSPKLNKDGEPGKDQCMDEQQLVKVTTKKSKKVQQSNTGGPFPSVSFGHDARR